MNISNRTFFLNVKNILKDTTENIEMLKDQKELLLQMDVDFVSVVMGNIEEAAVSAYSINLYVTKISEFYREIMQEGLLRKIRGLNFQHCSTKNCLKNIQKFIVKDCKATQESIRERVRLISSIYVV